MGDCVVVEVVVVVVVIGSVAQLDSPNATRMRAKDKVDLSFSMGPDLSTGHARLFFQGRRRGPILSPVSKSRRDCSNFGTLVGQVDMAPRRGNVSTS